MLRLLPKSFVFGLLALAAPLAALANATVVSMQGDVRANGTPVTQNQRLTPGTTLVTGPNSQLVMRFEDDQRIALSANTEFRIVDFRYNSPRASDDRSVFDFVRGALRIVTGAVANRNPASFQLRAPQATIGVRGTDFMVTIVNPLYVSVLSGTVGLTNAAGTLALSAGSFGLVSTAGTLATTVAAGALPAGVTGTFGALGAVPGVGAGVGAGAASASATGGAASGAAAATGTTAGASLGAAAGIAVGATAAAAASTSSDAPQTTTPTTTHHP